jgi:hypothetical protein
VLKDVRGIAFSHFNSEDVVRHPLVARIVDAYETAHNHEAEIAPLLKATALKNVRKNKLTLSVQYADPACRKPSPVPKSASGAGRAVRAGRTDHPLCRCRRRPALNREYRGKDYATNVLTFAYNEGEENCRKTRRPRPTSSCAPTCWRRKRPSKRKPWKNTRPT